jgi:two-component system secretion response regulator SsrB
MTQSIRILLLSPNPADADVIGRALADAAMTSVVTRVGDREAFTSAVVESAPDVIIADYWPNAFDVRGALDVVRQTRPATPVIVLTESITGAAAVACLRAGADDIVLLANIKRLATAISDAISRRSPLSRLTTRQFEVMRLVAEGHRTRDIADQLKLSVKTVESHRGEVMKRLEMHGVVKLVRYAMQVGLVSPS